MLIYRRIYANIKFKNTDFYFSTDGKPLLHLGENGFIPKKYRILEQKGLYRSFCPAPSFLADE